MLFRSEVYTRKLFPFFSADDAIIYVNDFWKNLNDFRFIIPAGFLFSTRLPVRFLKKIRGSVPEIFVYLAIFWASVYCIYVGSNDPFLYFRFKRRNTMRKKISAILFYFFFLISCLLIPLIYLYVTLNINAAKNTSLSVSSVSAAQKQDKIGRASCRERV